MRRLLPILASASLLLPGCSIRERRNPFDPLNPATSGRPAGFIALGGDREVTLRWQTVQGATLVGYRLFRRGPGQSTFAAITDVLGPSTGAFRDFPLVNGQDYAYRLYYVFRSGLGSRPAEAVAAPGAAVPWLIENGGSQLVRITPDNRGVAARRGGFAGTTDVAVNPANGDVWVADEGQGRVVVFQSVSGITVSVPGFSSPRAVAVDPFDGTGWVCDRGRNLVQHIRRDGIEASPAIPALDQPVDVAVDPQDGSAWLCELGGSGRITRYDASQPLWSRALSAPSRVAVDSTTREGWVTSYANGTVTHLSPTGQLLGSLSGFDSPLGVAVDPRRGRVWIADPRAGQVIALDGDGREAFRVSGLTDAGELAVDLGTGDAWVVLGAPGALVRISPDGSALRTQGGFRFPFAVAVDPGGR